MTEYDPTRLADEACATLRRGLGRTRKLAIEARHRLSELTSQTVYPGPAEFILADPNAHSEPETSDPAADQMRRKTTA